jgi:hypothetical protein
MGISDTKPRLRKINPAAFICWEQQIGKLIEMKKQNSLNQKKPALFLKEQVFDYRYSLCCFLLSVQGVH